MAQCGAGPRALGSSVEEGGRGGGLRRWSKPCRGRPGVGLRTRESGYGRGGRVNRLRLFPVKLRGRRKLGDFIFLGSSRLEAGRVVDGQGPAPRRRGSSPRATCSQESIRSFKRDARAPADAPWVTPFGPTEERGARRRRAFRTGSRRSGPSLSPHGPFLHPALFQPRVEKLPRSRRPTPRTQ